MHHQKIWQISLSFLRKTESKLLWMDSFLGADHHVDWCDFSSKLNRKHTCMYLKYSNTHTHKKKEEETVVNKINEYFWTSISNYFVHCKQTKSTNTSKTHPNFAPGKHWQKWECQELICGCYRFKQIPGHLFLFDQESTSYCINLTITA